VEFAIDYSLGLKEQKHVWEAYFFVPESFYLDGDTYVERAIHDDLWSCVRGTDSPCLTLDRASTS
jgi:hypothetical protein